MKKRRDTGGTRLLRPEDQTFPTDRVTSPSPRYIVVADGLPLERLYARFDAIAKGLVHGDSSAAHRSVVERLAANQRLAEALGWTGFVLARIGGSGRLELRGVPAPGRDRELVPDAIPYDVHEPTVELLPDGTDPERAQP